MRRAHVVTHAIKSDAYSCPVVRVVQLDIGVWFTRPLTRKILDAAAKNVQHFRQLRTVLVEKLLDGIGLTAGIDCYLGSLRDLSDEQYDDYCHQQVYCPVGYTHTHPFNGPLSGTTRVSRYEKGKTNLDFIGARDSEWQWHQLGMCKSAPRSRQITTPASHHSVFHRPDALPAAQPTASKH